MIDNQQLADLLRDCADAINDAPAFNHQERAKLNTLHDRIHDAIYELNRMTQCELEANRSQPL
jgi:hypothetical protein